MLKAIVIRAAIMTAEEGNQEGTTLTDILILVDKRYILSVRLSVDLFNKNLVYTPLCKDLNVLIEELNILIKEEVWEQSNQGSLVGRLV